MADQNDLLLSLARNRLVQLRNASLKDITVNYIVANHELLLGKANNRALRLSDLPANLRNLIFNLLCKEKSPTGKLQIFKKFDSRLEAFRQLLNTQTLRIDLTGILTFCPTVKVRKAILQLIRAIAVHAPNVIHLKIDRAFDLEGPLEGSEYYCRMVTFSVAQENELAKLQKLRSLHFGDLVRFTYFFHVTALCKRLPSLQVLRVRFWKIATLNYPSARLLRESFPSLVSYRFTCRKSKEKLRMVEDFLDKLCSENAEALPKVNHSTKVVCCSSFASSERTIYTGTPWKFHKVLVVPTSDPIQPDLCRKEVPELFYDYFWSGRDETEAPSTDGSLSISSFYADKFTSPWVVLERFPSIAQTLRTLHLKNNDIDLTETIRHCTKLERLTLSGLSPVLSNLSRLRELNFTSGIMDHVLFSRILSAPNLEKVSIESEHFDGADVQNVVSMITAGKILTKLHSFELSVYFRLLTQFDRSEEIKPTLEAIRTLLLTSSAYLPLLSDLRLIAKLNIDGDDCSRTIKIRVGKEDSHELCLDFRSCPDSDLGWKRLKKCENNFLKCLEQFNLIECLSAY